VKASLVAFSYFVWGCFEYFCDPCLVGILATGNDFDLGFLGAQTVHLQDDLTDFRGSRGSSADGSEGRENNVKRVHSLLGSDDRPRQNDAAANYDADPFAWTGQKLPVSALMDRAVRKPDEFCQLVASAFFASKSERRQRRAAERKEWMQPQYSTRLDKALS